MASTGYDITKSLIQYNRPGTALYPIGVINHSTATPEATAQNEFNYFNGGNRDASAHFFVDWTSILQFVPENEQAWHALSYANAHFLSIELCETADPGQFAESYKRYVWLNAYLCDKYKWAPEEAVHSHKWVSDTYEGDHQDPIAYLAGHGVSWDDHIQNVKTALADLQTPTQNVDLIRVVNADVLNVRSGPGANNAVRYQLKNGQQVHLTQLQGDWAFTDYGGLGGWVNRSYLGIPYKYAVYQRDKHITDFIDGNDAIAEAKKWDHSSVRDIATGNWLWDNYPGKFTVVATPEKGDPQTLGTVEEDKLDQLKKDIQGGGAQ